ncbi:MAG: choice-of-anchor R domain-containing protein [Planctomycetota bacterium]
MSKQRVSISVIGCVSALLIFASAAQATVLFDNFGVNDTYNLGNGAQVIDDGGSSIRQIGASFVVPNTTYPWRLDSIELPLSLQLGTSNSFDVEVQANSPGLNPPLDTPNGSFINSGLGLATPVTPTPSIHTANYSGAMLQPGTKYWVVVDGNQNRGVWHYNVLGQNRHAVNLSTFGWSTGNGPNFPKPAFRINATIVPPECYLENHSFESSEFTAGGPPNGFLDWAGDASHITGPALGITPHSGQRMLQFDGTTPLGGSPGTVGSEVWQLVDVSHLSTQISAGNVFADFEYYANRVAEEPDGQSVVDTLFSARIQANAGSAAAFPSNVNNFLSLSTSNLISDNDEQSWQRLSTSMQVPAGTTFLAVRVAAVENVTNDGTNEFAGHFADSACVNIRVVPEPATFYLLGATLAVLLTRRTLPA